MGLVAVAGTLTLFVTGLTIAVIGSSITGPAPADFVAAAVAVFWIMATEPAPTTIENGLRSR